MKDPVFDKPLSDLRRRMQEDMAVRRFGEKTQADYIRHVENFVKFLGRSPETARCLPSPAQTTPCPLSEVDRLPRSDDHEADDGVRAMSGMCTAINRFCSSFRGRPLPEQAKTDVREGRAKMIPEFYAFQI